MVSDQDQPAHDTDAPSVLFLAPGRSTADAVETALSRHDLAVSIEYDIAQVLDSLPTTDIECLVVPDGLPSISSAELLDEVRDRDPFLPVVFLLTLAREGDRALTIEPVPLAAVVDDCWETVGTGDASLSVETEATVHADRGQLRQLVENLIRNAVEHGGAGVTVTVGECDRGFYVGDTGPGIPEDGREDVFDAGYSTSENGTGFGLSIVDQVVEDHDWAISLTESAAGGARFEITGVEFQE